MPETPRHRSELGYYHLTLRGNAKQIIFEARADYIHFLNLLKQYSESSGVVINAFCLMENHVHLLVCDKEAQIPKFMYNLAGSYAIWFNHKYKRTGHLFQGRYGCNAIESEYALLTVFRYIINNPKDAGICPSAEYPWSSYDRYGEPDSFVDTQIFEKHLGSFDGYKAFLDEKYEIDDEIIMRDHDDEWAKSIIRESLQGGIN